MSLFDDGVPNLSIFSLPVTLFLAALPHWYTIYLCESKKIQGGWTNENPRAFVARLNARAAQGKKLSKVEEMVLRGQSAQQNGFEWFPVWAVAVVSVEGETAQRKARSPACTADGDAYHTRLPPSRSWEMLRSSQRRRSTV